MKRAVVPVDTGKHRHKMADAMVCVEIGSKAADRAQVLHSEQDSACL